MVMIKVHQIMANYICEEITTAASPWSMLYVNYNIFIFSQDDIFCQETKTTAASILKRQATKSVDELKMSVCLIFEIAISQFFSL